MKLKLFYANEADKLLFCSHSSFSAILIICLCKGFVSFALCRLVFLSFLPLSSQFPFSFSADWFDAVPVVL